MNGLKNSYLREDLSENSNFFFQASLVKALLWAKFQVEIQKYDFAKKLRFYRKNLLKIRYLDKEEPANFILLVFSSLHMPYLSRKR